jgi:predicted alpha-1,2-mannosidase
MKKTPFLLLPCLLLGLLHAQPHDPLRYVNPFIGTGGHGHTYPGATAPFGMVQLSPDTRLSMLDWDGCSGYHHSDSVVYGFSHTHLSGTGVADYCDILFMPYVGPPDLELTRRGAFFQKKDEKAEAGYYALRLNESRIAVELTATEHVGLHRYTFPQSRERGSLMLDLRHRDAVLDAHLARVSDREIEGYRISSAWAKAQHVYFVARFSQPFANLNLLDLGKDPAETGPSVRGQSLAALLDFDNRYGGPLVVAVGISGVSMEAARRNLEAECAHLDFERTKRETQAKWRQQLAKITVEGGTDDQKTVFYTALYHTMIVPNRWSDTDGQYRGRDGKIHRAPADRAVYTVFSLWDTYRACNPLYTILEPRRSSDFIRSFLLQYEQAGLLPIWELAANETDCMIGNHAIPVIADAYVKGIRDYDADLALKAMLHSTNQDRYGMRWYRELGYIPADKEPESVSKTLEYAYDDWCVAQMAQAMGRPALQAEYQRRAYNFLHIFDPETGFFRAKHNATWHSPFDPFEVNFHYTEANAWQYRFAAPQDCAMLSKLHGGALAERLDALFEAPARTTGRDQADITGMIGQYVHGNEPSHHMAYLYAHCGRPQDTQRRVRQIMDEQYANRPDGLSGNEDCGQMSAWFVLSALGFYPLAPGDGLYTLGTPLFPSATLHLEDGKTFRISAPGASAARCYVGAARLNGQALAGPTFPHAALAAGGTLDFDMQDSPAATVPGGGAEMPAWPLTPVPFVAKGQRVFRGSQTIELGCLRPDATLYCALPGGPPLADAPYRGPITLQESATLRFQAVSPDGTASPVETAFFSKIPDGLRVLRYHTDYAPQYSGSGPECLIDGLRGSATDFRTGDWQGFEGKNMDLTLDLGSTRRISKVQAGFLQDENAWIFFPSALQVEISKDGRHFTPVGTARPPKGPEEKGVWQSELLVAFKPQRARYVRITGVSLGLCPDWHKGRGKPCWVFADELRVE